MRNPIDYRQLLFRVTYSADFCNYIVENGVTGEYATNLDRSCSLLSEDDKLIVFKYHFAHDASNYGDAVAYYVRDPKDPRYYYLVSEKNSPHGVSDDIPNVFCQVKSDAFVSLSQGWTVHGCSSDIIVSTASQMRKSEDERD
jgi:hypothetical protein